MCKLTLLKNAGVAFSQSASLQAGTNTTQCVLWDVEGSLILRTLRRCLRDIRSAAALHESARCYANTWWPTAAHRPWSVFSSLRSGSQIRALKSDASLNSNVQGPPLLTPPCDTHTQHSSSTTLTGTSCIQQRCSCGPCCFSTGHKP